MEIQIATRNVDRKLSMLIDTAKSIRESNKLTIVCLQDMPLMDDIKTKQFERVLGESYSTIYAKQDENNKLMATILHKHVTLVEREAGKNN